MLNQTSITPIDVFSVSGSFWLLAIILLLLGATILEAIYKVILANETIIRKMIFNVKFQILSRLYAMELSVCSLLDRLENLVDTFFRNGKNSELNRSDRKRIKQ